MKCHCVIIIPSLNPNIYLVDYIKKLIENGFSKIIVINDGSNIDTKPIFDTIASFKECDVLCHAVNMGKGRALKDAFNYYCNQYYSDYSGVITVDADGQHEIDDVVKIDMALGVYSDSLTLGVRNFDDPCVPFKSRFGNKMTMIIIKYLLGGDIHDTQTGLRGIPNSLIKTYLTLYGERYEYETSMLIEALHQHTPIHEIVIQTIYIEGNKETHFKPVTDSFSIYRLIFSTFFKYILSSLSCFVIDYALFCVLILILSGIELVERVWISTIVSRIISSFCNYLANRNYVFHNRDKHQITVIKYYILCIFQMCCSATLVWLASEKLKIAETLIKLIVDMLLFLLSFQFQKRWVFKEDKK